jgi:hypothetical protein
MALLSNANLFALGIEGRRGLVEQEDPGPGYGRGQSDLSELAHLAANTSLAQTFKSVYEAIRTMKRFKAVISWLFFLHGESYQPISIATWGLL